jgi:hypothetical protein
LQPREVTFNVNDKEHTIYFPKKIDRKYGLNSIKNIETIKVGEIYCSRLNPKEEYKNCYGWDYAYQGRGNIII